MAWVSLAPALSIFENEALAVLDPTPSPKTFFPSGRYLGEGDLLKQEALGTTLELIAAQGPSALYGGPLGARFAQGLRAAGSAMTVEDLAAHSAEVAPPLIGRYRDLDVTNHTSDPPGLRSARSAGGDPKLRLVQTRSDRTPARSRPVFAATALDRDHHLADPAR